MQGWVVADSAYAALGLLPGSGPFRAAWPASEGPESGPQVERVSELGDLRNWRTGMHSGSRHVIEGQIYGKGKA